VFTGVLTAFYVTRALWMTFHGQPRDRHLYDHAHESPAVMTVPLVALAVGSVGVGAALGFPPEGGFIHRFLGPVVEAAERAAPEHLAAEYGPILALAAVSVAAGLVGIGIGLSMYVRHRPDPSAVARAAGGLYTVLVNRYWVDELYDHRVIDAAKAFAGATWAFDIHIIDGLVNRLGWLATGAASLLRRTQTGVVGNYALSVMAGLLAVLVLYGGLAAGVIRR